MPKRETLAVNVEGRALTLSNPAKILYPAAGFSKAEVVDYYRRIAPALIPHLKDRPLTLKRYPNGVDSKAFFEKNATKARPEWIRTVPIYGYGRGEHLNFILCDDLPALIFIANLAALELHPSLSHAANLEQPSMVVFDLDPGPPADLVTCCKAALVLRGIFQKARLESFAKTSGNKGMQLYVPLNSPANYEDTKGWARAIAEDLEQRMPELFVAEMKKSIRDGKIFIDWSQNDFNKTTISVYSLRARERPTVSTPITWEEIEECAQTGDKAPLIFEAPQVLARVEELGDVFGPVLTLKQNLPAEPRVATKSRSPRLKNKEA